MAAAQVKPRFLISITDPGTPAPLLPGIALARHLGAEHADAARRGRHQAHNHRNGGGFSRPIAAEQAGDDVALVVDGHVLGAILNQVPTKGNGASRYGYYGKYYYSSTGEGRLMEGAAPVEPARGASRGARVADGSGAELLVRPSGGSRAPLVTSSPPTSGGAPS